MNTPWGSADFVDNISEGIVQVSTPSHGGIGVDIEKANTDYAFSDYARDISTESGGYYWFEEDCDWSIAVLEVKTFDIFSEKVIDDAIDCAEKWHPCYVIGRKRRIKA